MINMCVSSIKMLRVEMDVRTTLIVVAEKAVTVVSKLVEVKVVKVAAKAITVGSCPNQLFE